MVRFDSWSYTNKDLRWISRTQDLLMYSLKDSSDGTKVWTKVVGTSDRDLDGESQTTNDGNYI